MDNKKIPIDDHDIGAENHDMGTEIVGNILICYPKIVPEQEIDVIRKIVRDAQKIKPRCVACYPCVLGVVGCDEDRKPHGHGSSQRCPECGVPYAYVHPHSNVCSKGIIVSGDVMHDEYQLHRQLEWKKDRY